MKKYIIFGIVLLAATACNNQKTDDKLASLTSENQALQTKVEAYEAEEARLERNKKSATDFLQGLVGDKDFSVLDKYIGDTYIQHNPDVADGKEALRAWIPGRLKNSPKRKLTFKRVSAEGDLVWFQVAFEINAPDKPAVRISIIENFRFKDGKIVEHWDTVQKVVLSEAVNKHPLF